MEALWQKVHAFNTDAPFFMIFSDKKAQRQLRQMAERLAALTVSERDLLSEQMGHLSAEHVDLMARSIEKLKDIHWRLENDILANIEKIQNLANCDPKEPSAASVSLFKKLNAVLNSIDRLEVRGRDSAGISILFIFKEADFQKGQDTLEQAGHLVQFNERCDPDPLVNGGINVRPSTRANGKKQVAVAVTYKVALEIGSLGDNVDYLRRQIANDAVFQILATIPADFDTVSAHTRWASVGAITEANCHPVDNHITGDKSASCGIIHTCLNGDIDNFQLLRAELEGPDTQIHSDITTDTKIIPLKIQQYVYQGHAIDEAFRLAVNDFEGSHAISMHTDLAPGKLFLAQRGSGQAIFVGIADEHYMASSEVYGFVEETPYYLKLDGEKTITGKQGRTQGQIFVLDQTGDGGLDGISACYYDGTPLVLTERDRKYTEITTRDIDRQNFPHYFLKEISESPASVDKTLQNRWKFKEADPSQYTIALDETIIPQSLQKALTSDQIKRIFFIGQGTAGVAALACANILNYYLDSPAIQISALKASEFSGFNLNEHDSPHAMSDTLIVAISQSGTTTDTNRTVDMVKERGSYTLAIVNRRDSDITFKVDGVMYTSSGRDIEMSVASTKAFYSQIVAGAVLGLYIARLKNRRDDAFVARQPVEGIEGLLRFRLGRRDPIAVIRVGFVLALVGALLAWASTEVVLVALGLMALTPLVGMNFFPRADDKPMFLVRVKAPQGTNIAATLERALRFRDLPVLAQQRGCERLPGQSDPAPDHVVLLGVFPQFQVALVVIDGPQVVFLVALVVQDPRRRPRVLALDARIFAAHNPLQLGEFVDHLGLQIALRKSCRPFGQGNGRRFETCGQSTGDLHKTFDLLVAGAEFRLVDDLL